jgi:hypothetical protein
MPRLILTTPAYRTQNVRLIPKNPFEKKMGLPFPPAGITEANLPGLSRFSELVVYPGGTIDGEMRKSRNFLFLRFLLSIRGHCQSASIRTEWRE